MVKIIKLDQDGDMVMTTVSLTTEEPKQKRGRSNKIRIKSLTWRETT